jgi:uncharacterized membrane protein YadS
MRFQFARNWLSLLLAKSNEVTRWCLVTAIAPLGMKASFKDLASVGWRPIALMVFETAWIAAITIIAVLFAN